MTTQQKLRLDSWYNSLSSPQKENIPHWRESDYNQRLILKQEYMLKNNPNVIEAIRLGKAFKAVEILYQGVTTESRELYFDFKLMMVLLNVEETNYVKQQTHIN